MAPKKPKNLASAPPNTANVEISPEAAQQFELELYWCIQQLQSGLRLGKLNPKQVQDHTKTLNTLMSKTAPLVKKRQVMRMAFGDYRTKMLEEDKKNASAVAKVKVSKVVPSTKSVFVKKSNLNFVPSNNTFRFNFNND
ncbi:UPF0488 protein CG14286 [Onthophagus taurus]|uniref:UPF0488 protein CG14286 n=1 Tax=Onthophagus taurus TaxID=166361 RepID=UPI0039BE415B